MSSPSSLRLLHFGKLPSRGDFVRSAQPAGLIQTLDDWLASGMEALAADTRWKLLYDRTAPTHFAFLGSRATRGLVGHLLASHDASGRRFPFLVAAPLEVQEPASFLARSPLVLAKPWQRFEALARQVYVAPDGGAKLAELSQADVAIELSARAVNSHFQDFLEAQTLGSTQNLLLQAGHSVSLRSLLLGLGLLLEKVPASGLQRLDKGLLLPLPQDPLMRPLVASLWLELVGAFLSRAAFELVLLLPQGGADFSAPVLALGFDGPTPQTLQALIDAETRSQVFLDAAQADWVEEFVGSDYAVQKLSSYLQHPDLSLRQAVATFKETFLGC
jgi:type VI secretion system protein ImpM